MAMVLIVEARTRNTAVAIRMRWEWTLTSLNLLEPWNQSDNFVTLHPAPTGA